MMEKFDENKSHEENVKVAIDSILGQKTELKRKRRTQEDQKRALFSKIINNLIESQERSLVLNEMYSIDMNKYESVFFDVIDDLIDLIFNKEQVNLINFYLYDRYAPDGSIIDLVDLQGNIVKLETPDDLWYILKNLEHE